VRYTTNNSTLPTRYTYTGQYSYMDDPATDLGGAGFGLMFYNARWYDPVLGRFNQPDTLIPEQTQGTQAWDRFAYTNNNPVKFSDPTGHCAAPGLSIICGVAIGYVAGALVSYTRQVVANVKENGWSASAFTEVDANDIAASAIVGGIAGGLIGSGVGASAGAAMIASSAGTGMAVSALGYTVAAGDDYETSEMVGSAIIGGVAGALSGGVSNILKTPLPLNNRLPINDSGVWFAKASLNGLINGGANAAQMAIYGDPKESVGVGVLGGYIGFGLDLLGADVPVTSFVRSFTGEYFMNEGTDCDGKRDFDVC